MLSKEVVENELVEYLQNEIGIDVGLARTEALFSAGRIDSFDIVQLLGF